MLLPQLVRTKEDLRSAVEHVSKFDHFVIDVETSSLVHVTNDVVWVGLGVPGRVFLIPLGHPIGPVLIPEHTEMRVPPLEERKVLQSGKLSEAKKPYKVPAVYGDPGEQLRPDIAFDILSPLLLSDRTKIGANLKFDLMSLRKYVGEIPGPYEDTILIVHTLDENLLTYGLKELTIDHFLRIPVQAKEKRKKAYPKLAKGGIMDKPMDAVARYLAKDLWYTLLLYRYFGRRLRKVEDLTTTYEAEMAFYPCVMDMESYGVRLHREMFADRGVELEREIQEISEAVWDICGEEFKLTDLNKKKHYVFGKKSEGGQGLKPFNYTKKTREPQLNAAFLEAYAERNQLCALLLQHAKAEKLYATFVTGLMSRMVDGRLHTNFKQHGTVTGRISSAEPNLQQIPRGDMMKKGFVADDGHLMIVADYSQIEMRCAGFLSQDPEIIRIYQEGLDIHREAASAMFEILLEDVTEQERQVGKTQNFGTLYGASDEKIAWVAGVSIDRAERFVRRYYERFARLEPWKEEVIAQARKTSKPGSIAPPYVSIPPFGRRRRLHYLYSQHNGERARAERQAINSMVQGFAANIMKLAMIDLRKQIHGTDIHLMLNVHDEAVLQVPEDRVDEAVEIVRNSMEGVTWQGQPIIGEIPLVVDIGTGRSWKEAK